MELLLAVLQRRGTILKLSLGIAVVSSIVLLLIPNTYTGRVLLLPPSQSAGAASLLAGQNEAVASIAASALKLRSSGDLYAGMLQSRSVVDAVIAKFGLAKLYEKPTMVETRKAVGYRTSVRVGRDGLIALEYDEENPELAAAIANYYVEALEQITNSLAISEAAQRRLFLEKHLSTTRTALAKAESELIKVQATTGLLVPEQAQMTLTAAATIRAQIVAKEVEVASLQAFATATNPELIKNSRVLAELRSQLNKIERATTGDAGAFVPFSKLPDAGAAYLSSWREVKYQERLFEFLSRQLEAARLDEAKEGVPVQIIDRAVVPDRKTRPYRALWVVALTLLGGIGACVYFAVGHMVQASGPDQQRLASEIGKELRSALTAWLPFRKT